jgi:hypothetical protein
VEKLVAGQMLTEDCGEKSENHFWYLKRKCRLLELSIKYPNDYIKDVVGFVNLKVRGEIRTRDASMKVTSSRSFFKKREYGGNLCSHVCKWKNETC